MKKCDVGGQALFEGVLMRSTKGKAIARRKDNGKIDVQFERMFAKSDENKIISKPFIRGIFIFVNYWVRLNFTVICYRQISTFLNRIHIDG